MRRAGHSGAALAAVVWAVGGAALAEGASGLQQAEAAELRSGPTALALVAERPPETPGALRIDVRGGEPFEALALRIDGPNGPVLQAIALDAQGSWQRTWRDVELDAGVGVSVLRSAGGVPKLGGKLKLPKRPAAGTTGLHQGQVIVTEILKDPVHVSDSQGEWIEIVNVSHGPIDIEGWTLSDLGANSHTFTNGGQGIVLPPGMHFVAGNQLDPLLNGGVLVNYKYSSFTLSNGADEVILRDAQGALQDIVAYDDGVLWPEAPGVALNLSLGKFNSGANDDPASWCDALLPIGPTNPDLGTPGKVNALCP
jgi:hypothetical protein